MFVFVEEIVIVGMLATFDICRQESKSVPTSPLLLLSPGTYRSAPELLSPLLELAAARV